MPSTLLALTPILSLLTLIRFSAQYPAINKHLTDWRQAVLVGGVLWGLWLTLVTEGLSLFHQLRFYPVLVSHSLLIAVLVGLLVWGKYPLITIPSGLSRLTLFFKLLLAVMAGIIIITGLVGVISAPNNYDSMTYHLSRVMHWIQNRSVSHYATHEVRQLYQNPGAEFVVLQLQLLGGNDRFANWVQWLSMIGSALGVSFIAKQLGANLPGQLFSALTVLTIPMGVLQAVTTQNDYVATFWLASLVSSVLSIRQAFSWFYSFSVAGSLSLGILTKGTTYVYAAPFMLWLVWRLVKSRGRQALLPLIMIGSLVLLVNGGHYSRNFQLFGSPLKPQTLAEYDYTNQRFGIAEFTSNLLRNVALHINTPSSIISHTAKNIILAAHQAIGIAPDDPAITWPGTHFDITSFKVDEDASGNFLHLLLILGTLVVVITPKQQKKDPLLFSFASLWVAAFLLFCLYLKWQPWHSRLHLPLFVLSAAIIGIILTRPPLKKFTGGIAFLLIVQAMPFLFTNPLHPFTGPHHIFNTPRQNQYFISNPGKAQPYQAAAEFIEKQGCRQIGLTLPGDYWEYPFWIFLQKPGNAPKQIQSIQVNNETDRLQPKDFEPCAVICINCPSPTLELYTQQFNAPALSSGPNFLFLK